MLTKGGIIHKSYYVELIDSRFLKKLAENYNK